MEGSKKDLSFFGGTIKILVEDELRVCIARALATFVEVKKEDFLAMASRAYDEVVSRVEMAAKHIKPPEAKAEPQKVLWPDDGKPRET